MPQNMENDHERLREIMLAFVQAMGRQTPEMQGLMKQRLEFATLFRKTLAQKTQHLEQIAQMDLTPELHDNLEKHRQEMRMIFLDYTDLVRTWTPDRIVANWTDYCTEIRIQWARFVNFLEWEEEFFRTPGVRVEIAPPVQLSSGGRAGLMKGL